MPKSLYIHIPFCKQKCLYCDFYSIPFSGELAKNYIETLCQQIENLKGIFPTIYIGGGTPSILGHSLLAKLLAHIHPLAKHTKEFTIEINPDSADKEKLTMCKKAGVNRISIGVQSFDDKALKSLGRVHDRQCAIDTITLAHACGFKNINIDLIFGIPGQTDRDLEIGLKYAASLPVTHISAYALSYETHTPLKEQLVSKQILPLEDEVTAAMYSYIMDFLPTKGFLQYEISNFAKKGFSCRHNINYWNNGEYVGLGPGAVTYHAGVRSKNTTEVCAYIKKANSGKSTYFTREQLSPRKQAKETAAVRIRTAAGIDFLWFKRKTGYDFLKLEHCAIRTLSKEMLINVTKNNIHLTRKGFLFCDTVSSELL